MVPLLFVLLSFLFDKVSLFPSVEVNAFELLHIILRADQMHFSSIHLQPAEQNKRIKGSMVSFFLFSGIDLLFVHVLMAEKVWNAQECYFCPALLHRRSVCFRFRFRSLC